MRTLLHHPFVRTHFPKFWRFAVCGGIGSLIDLGSLHLFVSAFEVSQYIAPIYSTLLSVTFVFLANRFFTFREAEKKYGSQALKFAFVYGVAIIMNIALTNTFIWVGIHYLLAKVLAIGVGVFWNYFMSHGFVFKASKEEDVAVF